MVRVRGVEKHRRAEASRDRRYPRATRHGEQKRTNGAPRRAAASAACARPSRWRAAGRGARKARRAARRRAAAAGSRSGEARRGSSRRSPATESNRMESHETKQKRIESNRIESNRNESNRIESNRVESNRIEWRDRLIIASSAWQRGSRDGRGAQHHTSRIGGVLPFTTAERDGREMGTGRRCGASISLPNHLLYGE